MMHYLINIGNTHTQVAVMQDGKQPLLLARYDTPELLTTGCLPLLENDHSDWTAVASSVVPKVTQRLQDHYAKRLKFLSARDFHNIDCSLVDTTTLGIDRLCSAAGALVAVGHGPVIVLDCGTCIVTESLDAQNRFCGGAIMPGRMLLRQALADHTAQLPLIELQSEEPSPLGKNTHDAILAGTDLAALGHVRHLIQKTRQALHDESCVALATGGDAPFFLRHLPELTPAPDFLTLRGIAATGI